MSKQIPATQLTLKHLRADPRITLVEKVERWNAHTKITQDMWGIIDVIAIGPDRVVAVQTTSASHVANRRRKMMETRCTEKSCPNAGTDHTVLAHLVEAGIEVRVHGWDRVKASTGRTLRYELTRDIVFELDTEGGS